MKKTLLAFVLCITLFSTQAQTLERFVIASSGDYFPVGPINISFTIGELAAVESFLTNPLLHLTQGFQQPDASYKSVPTLSNNVNGFGLFPNPARERVGVHYDGYADGKIIIRLYNILGQELRHIETYPQIGQSDYVLDLGGISQGLYLVELTGTQSGIAFKEQAKLNVIY